MGVLWGSQQIPGSYTFQKPDMDAESLARPGSTTRLKASMTAMS